MKKCINHYTELNSTYLLILLLSTRRQKSLQNSIFIFICSILCFNIDFFIQQDFSLYDRSDSYITRKVWYHQIWINNLVFIVLILIYIFVFAYNSILKEIFLAPLCLFLLWDHCTLLASTQNPYDFTQETTYHVDYVVGE